MRHVTVSEAATPVRSAPDMQGAHPAAADYLAIDNIWKSFGDFLALKGVSLSIKDGEFVCFLGPSGCGKTTLLRAIAGLDLQTLGTIQQAGRDISTLPPSKRDYGIVFQSYALFPNLTIEKNIAFGLENANRPKAEIKARVAELLELVGLSSQAKKYPAQLSGGQQQRIALARAMAVSPGLLLLDEPLSALDAKVRVHLRHEIKELQRKLGVTTIMVTHDQEEALSMADRIVVMNHGVIEQIGTPTEVYRHPKTLFVADFIGETNQFPAKVTDTGRVALGGTDLVCAPHDIAPGSEVTAVIRPVDVIPHSLDGTEQIGTPENLIDVTVDQMEFLGSFWRCRLASPRFGENILVADFSLNAVRRLGIETGGQMRAELPQGRMLVFAKAG
ncbi:MULTISPECIES: putative 2-aminoethylphosphonate ABC transporter ATP-binding protein [Mesorhizobium]|uniref:Putative 2-aminoethylphosphonate ABC transporter ATP-binding protein n=1 Tax=Mesorhizobium denitrificans TaxID=2294114 RepID=A0A371XK26_9HYPH|nr:MULTISPECIES: putative 2-aminoethylphosphonate ABC transporter ATP-binding protein [Mesorhizobium]RFC69394.1 putative 2-aminoethylphosphonate ABC transporter ATP-binding protein [Mesorhizobium denitrificans]